MTEKRNVIGRRLVPTHMQTPDGKIYQLPDSRVETVHRTTFEETAKVILLRPGVRIAVPATHKKLSLWKAAAIVVTGMLVAGASVGLALVMQTAGTNEMIDARWPHKCTPVTEAEMLANNYDPASTRKLIRAHCPGVTP